MESRLAYVCGPLRGDIANNRIAAAKVALELFNKGYMPICPHTMLAGFEGQADETEILKRLCELIPMCHCIVLFGSWQTSGGAREELATARAYGVKVYGDLSVVPDAEHLELDTPHFAIDLIIDRLRQGMLTYREPLNARGNVTPKHVHEELADGILYLMDLTRSNHDRIPNPQD